MTEIAEKIKQIKETLPSSVTLVAVSKTKPVEDIAEAYDAGQRDFGENKVQEMTAKEAELPKDIQWHMIGHLQSNKVKYIAPFVYLIHSVDSIKLLKEINKRARQNNRVIKVLLQLHIAQEESKFGLTYEKAAAMLNNDLVAQMDNVEIVGFMGMATFTNDQEQVKSEFSALNTFFEAQQKNHPKLTILSMGMSNDYSLAISCGSNMIRVGSQIFGKRNY